MARCRLQDGRDGDAGALLAFEHPDWADIVQPPLSVVGHPTAEMAILAWEMLERRMQDPTAPLRRIQLQARVAQRQSMGRCPAGLSEYEDFPITHRTPKQNEDHTG
jgi:LacI family transcriptional regulator